MHIKCSSVIMNRHHTQPLWRPTVRCTWSTCLEWRCTHKDCHTTHPQPRGPTRDPQPPFSDHPRTPVIPDPLRPPRTLGPVPDALGSPRNPRTLSDPRGVLITSAWAGSARRRREMVLSPPVLRLRDHDGPWAVRARHTRQIASDLAGRGHSRGPGHSRRHKQLLHRNR